MRAAPATPVNRLENYSCDPVKLNLILILIRRAKRHGRNLKTMKQSRLQTGMFLQEF